MKSLSFDGVLADCVKLLLIKGLLQFFDWVVVHELCHLVHQDHSKQYWNKVRSIMPDYQSKKDWLKTNSSLLDW